MASEGRGLFHVAFFHFVPVLKLFAIFFSCLADAATLYQTPEMFCDLIRRYRYNGKI